MAAAGASAPAVYIEDVFTTYLYTGNGSTQTITNGIDLAGKGGMVWLKSRSLSAVHTLVDTARGAGKTLFSDLTNAQATNNAVSAFNADGFTMGSYNNSSGDTFASWTFRKQPKFFDVVTYTGNGTNDRTIAHALTSTPGCIMVKRTDSTGDWYVYHRAVTATNPQLWHMRLNSTAALAGAPAVWDNPAPSSTTFTVQDGTTNISGATYVAYLFAHNAGGFGLTGTDNVISCGSWSGNTTVNLGYEPQWILFRNSGAADYWTIVDNMRGWPDGTFSQQEQLYANSSSAASGGSGVYPTATGFSANIGAGNFIYIAIRRGPMKVPTDATKVYNAVLQTGNGTGASITTAGFSPDSCWVAGRNGANYKITSDKLIGTNRFLQTVASAAEVKLTSPGTLGILSWDMAGVTYNGYSLYSGNGNLFNYYFFKRAPSFFDEVCYTGTYPTVNTQTHNLGVAPELIIVKNRSSASQWSVYSLAWLNSLGLKNRYGVLNSTANLYATDTDIWNNTLATASSFQVNATATNANGSNFVAYLFATCSGVSKCGIYTGTGATQTISCGFTGGARLVLIKRADSTGDWWIWDTARGMVSGTDPRLPVNASNAESNADWVYTTTDGFQIVTSDASINASGGTYIFLAIA